MFSMVLMQSIFNRGYNLDVAFYKTNKDGAMAEKERSYVFGVVYTIFTSVFTVCLERSQRASQVT